MEKIKKRIETSLTQMQLAENEASRLKIQKKSFTLDEATKKMLSAIDKIANGLRADSAEEI